MATSAARRRLRWSATVLIVSAAALGATSIAPAQAALVSTTACDNSSLSQPFAQWADSNYYKLAPGGDFEGSLSGWSLGGAQQASDSEPYGVAGSPGSYSLSLTAGGSATSPQTCVNAAYPTFRFFARTDSPGAAVAVSVVYSTPLGRGTIPVGTVTLSGSWQPTLPMTTLSAIPGATGGGTANVALQFTELSGSSQIDDVFVDPWHS
jgi:hypothetical protein